MKTWEFFLFTISYCVRSGKSEVFSDNILEKKGSWLLHMGEVSRASELFFQIFPGHLDGDGTAMRAVFHLTGQDGLCYAFQFL